MRFNEYVDILSSKSPVPGGGGTSAMVGALGCALGNMVGSLTVGKPKYKEYEDQLWTLKDKAKQIQNELLTLTDRDPVVFERLSQAYKMPKSTAEEKHAKDEEMEKCLRDACQVPLNIMDACARAIKVIEDFAKLGSPLAISDAGVGAVFCKAALQGAALNVYINTKYMKNREYANEQNAIAESYVEKYCPRADRIYMKVDEKVHGVQE